LWLQAPSRQEAYAMFRKIVALPALLLLAACNWSECGDCMTTGGKGPKIEGSGTMKTEIRPVETFTAITLSDIESSLLVIERTGEESLSVTAEDNLLPLFTSTVKDGMLRLSLAKGNSFHGKRPTYKITVNDLRALHIQGGAAIEASKLEGDRLSISVEGAAGGSLAGRVDNLIISIRGAGAISAGELKAKRAKVTVQGAGQVTVNASEELDGEVSGAGMIWYVGSPKLNSKVNGVGMITRNPFGS
jgi:Putative auto-transporter adhesin, head GIN domain